jgi:hypothetical protein
VWVPDSGEDREDAVRVYAYDADLAARKWAEDDDAMSADYSIVGGTPATVGVAATGSAKVEWREVSGESVPEYRSREVEKP